MAERDIHKLCLEAGAKAKEGKTLRKQPLSGFFM
jgi:hypothetical protein